MIPRRSFLTMLAGAAIATRGGAGDVRLIAHRGGIVDDQHAENSPAAVGAAIERGYWMIEVDIRRTRDGRAVVQHDATFERFYNDPRAVQEMSWEDVKELRATPGGTSPMSFERLCARCAGRIRVMLDIKGDDHPAMFFQSIERSLHRHDLFETAYVLSGAVVSAFRGTLPRAVDRDALQAAVARGENVARTCYLFELAATMDEEAIELSRSHGVTAVAAVNRFRYEMAGVDHWRGAEADIRRLRALGVQHYQIDSIYDRYFAD